MSEDFKYAAALAKTEIDTQAQSLISEIEAEYKTAKIDAELEGFNAVGDAPVPAPTPQGKESQVNTGKPEDKDVPGLDRLVSREMDLRERDSKLSAKEQQLKDMEDRLKASRTMPQDFEGRLRADPVGLLTEMGYDPDQVVRTVLAQRLGDKAPHLKEEIKAHEREYSVNKRIAELESRLVQKEREAQIRTYFDGIASGAREYVGKLGDSEKTPTVARIAKAQPDRVHQEIMDEITRDAQVRSTREPNGEPINYDEAAKRVEARWAPLLSAMSPTPNANTTTPKTQATEANKASNPSNIKPPDRPLAPWLQRANELEQEGLKAALAEYKRTGH